MKPLFNHPIINLNTTAMKSFEILNTKQLLDIKGGANEMTQKDNQDEAIV